MIETPALGGERTPFRLSRRLLLAALGGAVASPAAAQAPDPLRTGTPQLTLGPFYPVGTRPELDADLTRVAGRPGVAYGEVIELFGQVRDLAGRPVPGARIDLWQTNGHGAYPHGAEFSGKPQDPNFQGGAIVTADAQGRYRVRTVKPLPYERRQRHIHFDVVGRQRRLITQMFFAGEPNEADSLFPAIRTAEQKLAATAVADGRGAGDVPAWRWDIVLSGES
jgi:protocatechuate 3,4-dioxygenase beta subunit